MQGAEIVQLNSAVIYWNKKFPFPMVPHGKIKNIMAYFAQVTQVDQNNFFCNLREIKNCCWYSVAAVALVAIMQLLFKIEKATKNNFDIHVVLVHYADKKNHYSVDIKGGGAKLQWSKKTKNYELLTQAILWTKVLRLPAGTSVVTAFVGAKVVSSSAVGATLGASVETTEESPLISTSLTK